jgi:hypothetical protein
MLLAGQTFSYAYWTNTREAETGLPVPGLGSHRFTVFPRPVLLQAMELTRPLGRLGGRPERAVIEAYADASPSGQVLYDGDLPWGPGDTCHLDLPATPVIAVSQRCHWRTPVQIDFNEWHPTRYTVPFNIFDVTHWFGEPGAALAPPEPPAPPLLERGTVAPQGGDGLTVENDGQFVRFRSRYLQIGFSLLRPRLSFLAWDGLGTGRVDKNFIFDARGSHSMPGSGPWRRHLGFELPPMLWGGGVEVSGRRVSYRGLNSLPGFTMDVDFEVSATGYTMRIAQHNEVEQTFLEAEAWRWVWDGRRVFSLSALARPQRGAHRNGIVVPYGGWHCTGQGVLSFSPVGAPPVGMQIDTSGFEGRQAFAGLLLGVRPEPFGPVTLLAGDHAAELEFKVTNVEPETQPGQVHPGLRRAWGSQFTFRPEHGGFSNNSFGVNAENCLYFIADLAPYTRANPPLPTMTELLRYTLELAIKGGPGYACFLEEAHDTAPAQLISAGRVYQAERSRKWVRDVWPFLARRVAHILGNLDENGFYVCRRLSGNSRSFHTSSNAWDTLCFGHADGYSGALAYRALRNVVVLARVVGDSNLAEQCDLAARRLQDAFVPTLFNPATGWLAGWRSRDGELHDHAMHFVTAMAAIYGILKPAQAREMLARLESKRLAAGLDDFRYGLAPQFMPVPARDHWSDGGWSRYEVPHRADGADTFGIFTNGGITPVFAGFYLRALSQFGFTATADRLSDQLLESFDRGQFEGCLNGAECYTLDGMPSGYEGTLAHSYHVLLAIGMHKGWIKPLAQEWWPEG